MLPLARPAKDQLGNIKKEEVLECLEEITKLKEKRLTINENISRFDRIKN